MTTIQPFTYSDEEVTFTCPALNIPNEQVWDVAMALHSTKWPKTLSEEGYICHTFEHFEVNADFIERALTYLSLTTEVMASEEAKGRKWKWKDLHSVTDRIRIEWCKHMANEIEREFGLTP